MPESDQVASTSCSARPRTAPSRRSTSGRPATCGPGSPAQQEEGLLGAGAGADLAHQQPDPDPRALPGVALHPGRPQGRALRRRERQQRQQAAYAARRSRPTASRSSRRASTLLATLGYPVFDAVAQADGSATRATRSSICTVVGHRRARALHAGGLRRARRARWARRANVPSYRWDRRDERFRQTARRDRRACGRTGERVVFHEGPPLRLAQHGGASRCSAEPANGWKEWKSKDGKTLDELKRATARGAAA